MTQQSLVQGRWFKWHAWPKLYEERFPWHAAFTANLISLFLLLNQRLCILKNIYICVCVCVSGCLQSVYEFPLLLNNTASKHFYTNRSIAKCWPDSYRWGAGLAVTGRIRDIGQNVLQSAFATGSSSSSQLLQYFVIYRLPEGSLY
jgi:hypothetical protein